MEKYTLKRVSVSDKKTDGTPLIDKNKKPYLKVGIQVEKHGQNWINGLFFAPTCPWKEGDEVELIIKEVVFNGKTKLEFELPKKENPLLARIVELETKFTKLNLEVAPIVMEYNERHGLVKPIAKAPHYTTPAEEGLDENNMANFGDKGEVESLDKTAEEFINF